VKSSNRVVPEEINLIIISPDQFLLWYIYIYNYYSVAGYKITYFVANLSYDNYYINLQYYSNSLLSGLL
jgi:hypothetical protein